MFEDKQIFLDFDGVILDSEQKILELKSKNQELSWDVFFEFVDWKKLLLDSNEIHNSLSIIRELEARNRQLFILTKVHTLVESLAKVEYLRSKNIHVPIFFVPPHVKKSQVYIPTENDVLIDDSLKNINDWNQHNGVGILFDEKAVTNEPRKIKDLKRLLK